MLQKLKTNLAASILSKWPFSMNLDLWAVGQLYQSASPDQLEKYCRHRIRQIVLHAHQHVPYYRELFGRIGIGREEIKTLSWEMFRTIPVLNKSTLREHEKEFYTEGWENLYSMVRTTSGSSGMPLKLLVDQPYIKRRVMMSNYYLKACGQKNIKKFANFMTVPDLKSWGVFFDVAQFRDRWNDLIVLLKSGSFESLGGPTSTLAELAEYLEKANEHLKLRFISSSAEYVSRANKDHLEKVFGCSLYNRYACAEVGVMAYTHKKCDFFHLSPATGWVEITDNAGKVLPPNETGKVIITGFENKIMPLIRYELGDLGCVIKEGCSCGLKTPRIIFEGRDFYFLRLPDGKNYSAFSLLGLFDKYYVGQIKQVQIIQETIDKIILRIIPTEHYNPRNSKFLVRDVLDQINCSQPITVLVEIVSSIARLPSGKTPFFLSKIHI